VTALASCCAGAGEEAAAAGPAAGDAAVAARIASERCGALLAIATHRSGGGAYVHVYCLGVSSGQLQSSCARLPSPATALALCVCGRFNAPSAAPVSSNSVVLVAALRSRGLAAFDAGTGATASCWLRAACEAFTKA
jgi:hypothetical protein